MESHYFQCPFCHKKIDEINKNHHIFNCENKYKSNKHLSAFKINLIHCII